MAAASDAPVAMVPSPSKWHLIAGLVNLLALLGTGGLVFYAKFVFKRPPITEEGERERLVSQHKEPSPPSVPTYVQFEQTTINIEAIPPKPLPAEGNSRQIEGKLHYATISFVVEIGDEKKKRDVEAFKPLIMDRVISLVGRKKFQDLTTVQGRYLLRTQILDSVRQLKLPPDLVSNIYFTNFIVQ